MVKIEEKIPEEYLRVVLEEFYNHYTNMFRIIKPILGKPKFTLDAQKYNYYNKSNCYDLVMENNETPFDIIITDLQMEPDFEPDYAGEWLVKQIKTFKNYSMTKIVIISATFNIRHIAEILGVECLPKSTARNFPQAYEGLFS